MLPSFRECFPVFSRLKKKLKTDYVCFRSYALTNFLLLLPRLEIFSLYSSQAGKEY